MVVDALHEAAAALGQELVLVGDPGCVVTVADRLDAKYALGSAVAVADGLSKAGIGGRAVALFGDSSFFHSMLPGICNAVVNQSDILMVVLDNGATVTTGFQPNPGVGRDALGRPAPRSASSGSRRPAVSSSFAPSPGMNRGRYQVLGTLFREALAYRGLGMVVVRMPCGKTVGGSDERDADRLSLIAGIEKGTIPMIFWANVRTAAVLAAAVAAVA